MESVLTLSQLLPVFAKLETMVNKFFDRRDIAQDNIETLSRLKRFYRDAAALIRKLEGFSTTDFVTMTRLCQFGTSLQDNLDTLTSVQGDVDNATIMNRVRRTKQVLEQCEMDVKEFFEFLSSNVSPELKEDSAALPQEAYVPDNNVPGNPPRLTLDYNATTNCEGKLKAAIMSNGSMRVVAVVASGQGGVGKTCALRGLATDSSINERFTGGTLYIQLGKDANLSSIIQSIAKIVERTGGLRLAQKIRTAKTLQEASDKASLWFRPHRCLFLVDDIWWVNGIDSNVFTILGTMVNEESRLVYSTRDQRFLGRSDTVIEFLEKETRGDVARRMLMTHADFNWQEKLNPYNEEALRGILDICKGLPLAFGIAGATVRKYSRKRVDDTEDAWTHYYQHISSKKENIAEGLAEQYGPLRLIVDNSLDVLESQNGNGKFQEMFRALCVLQKQQTVPVHMLQRLWNLKDLSDAEEVVERFDEVSVVRKVPRGNVIYVQLHDQILEIAIRRASEVYEVRGFFKTLIKNYLPKRPGGNETTAEQPSADDGMSGSGTRKKLGALSKLAKLWRLCQQSTETVEVIANTLNAVDPSLFQAWWDIEDDGYILDNLCRVLQKAGYYVELLWLLSKPQWIVRRLQHGWIYNVEGDLEHGKAAICNKSKGSEPKLMKHLDMVGKAARMSYNAVHENPREAWFQLHGRLVWYARQCENTQRFVKEIESCAPRPWAKASVGILEHAGGALLEVIQGSGTIRCLSQEENDVYFFWTGGESMGVTQYNVISGILRSTTFVEDEQDLLAYALCSAFSSDKKVLVTGHRTGRIAMWNRDTGRVIRILKGHRSIVTCVACSMDGTRIISGSKDKTIRIWDAQSGEAVGKPLIGHTSALRCVVLSADGTRIVSGSLDRTVRVWDTQRREALGQPLLGHIGGVTCIAMSADGTRIVSGSRDNTVRVWDAQSGEEAGQPLVGHTGRVWCVAVNADGTRIVSGSKDQTVRVWNANTGESVGNPLKGHTAWVECLLMSADCTRVLSGSWDGTVRVWDVQSVEAAGHRLVGHTKVVECVALSKDGTRILSGSADNTIRVWDTQSGEAVGQPLSGHTSWVVCVAISEDGTRIVSGSLDKTIRVWDAQSGMAIGPPLVGHSSWVQCLALSADGSQIVSGSGDRTVRSWDVQRGEALGQPLMGHTDTILCVTMSADGSQIISGSKDKTVRIWDLQNAAEPRQTLIGHSGSVKCVILNAVGTRIVSWCDDETVRIWDALNGRSIGLPFQLSEAVIQVGVDVHCTRVVSYERNGVGRLWNTGVGECLMTSNDTEWLSTLDALSLSWSPYDWFPTNRRVMDRLKDGMEVVLGTSDVVMQRFGDVCFSEMFSSCRIVR